MEGTSLLFWRETPLSALEQVSANRYVTMVIYQKLLPRTTKRGVFYLSLKISSLHRLASYDEYVSGSYKWLSVVCTVVTGCEFLNQTKVGLLLRMQVVLQVSVTL